MFDDKMLIEILDTEKRGRNVTCLKLFRLVSKKLKSVRELLKKRDGFSEYGRDGGNISLWLYENFPRLEQTSKNDVKTLARMGFLQGGNGLPRYYSVFSRLLFKELNIDERDTDRIFEICNNHQYGLDLKNAISLLCLFRLSVCVRICECFDEAFNDSGGERDLLYEIEKLFLLLDVLLRFGDERAIRNNPVEKMLVSDPERLYENLTDETKASYRKNLIRLSKKAGISQLEFAGGMVKTCEKCNGDLHHIGHFLCDKSFGGKTYIFLLVFLTVLFTTLLVIVSPLFLLSVFSVYGSTRLLLNKIYARFIIRKLCIPRVELSEVPNGSGVMVVITSLLDGSDNDKEIFQRLEKIYHSNGGKNVYFAALCDLCDDVEKETEKDREILKKANEFTLKLRQKYGGCFFLFLRERQYSQSEEMYVAPERKRGAVMSLVSFLCGKEDNFRQESIKPSENICDNVKYVLTLDADTNPEFDCVRKLVGIMVHPQNSPVSDKKKAVVTKGYGILQPRMVTTLASSKRSFFTSVLCGHGGVDGYVNANADASMSLFGRGIFCGKGMFEKNCFYDVLCGDNEFLENTVLSHDAPEGARLRCANLSDLTFTDSFPSEQLSYFKRQHRWIRGDIQNIPFIFGKVYTSDGRKIKNRINYASRFFMWENVFSAIIPIVTVLLLIVSAFCESAAGVLLVTVAMSFYILPVVYSFFSLPKRRIWHNIRRRFYSRGIYTGVWTLFLRMLLSVTFLVKEASVSLDAVLRSVYRSLVSHRKMLEWTTAAQNDREKKDGLLGYVKKNLPSAFVGAFLFAVSDNGFVRLVALMWFFAPIVAYYTGKERRRKSFVPSEKQRNTVLAYCSDMWKFFSENVNESTCFLPTDNVSLYPERKMSRMTSPTNIGLYLLSVLCARKLGFIDSKELDRRLCDTMACVASLDSFDGLLYNWYDIFLKTPMNPGFISSVDIGNYAACLICVYEGIDEFREEMPRYTEIRSLTQKLIEACRISKLYDCERRLFYIGATVENGKLIPDKNHYDMLMSEARILSFAAVAQRLVPSEHFKTLSRTFVEGKGYMGLASWSGTAFEYFMPEIFFPSDSASLVYEALCFSFFASRSSGASADGKYVFGISESCYNELDDAANYKYRAFGIPETALDVTTKQNVISPYSSFLFMNFAPNESLDNLLRLKELGAYGEYGFFESVDFERHAQNDEFYVVKCFMSHHVGMSIAAATNFLCEGAVSKWFSKNKKMDSALELMREAIPYDAYVRKQSRKHYERTRIIKESREEKYNAPTLRASLCDGKMHIGAKRGRVEIKYGELLAARRNCYDNSLGAFCLYAEIDGERFLIDGKSSLFSGYGRIKYSKKVRKSTGEYYEISFDFTLVKNTADTVRIMAKIKSLSGRNNPRVVLGVEFCPLLDIKKNNSHCFFFDRGDAVLEECGKTEVYFRRNSDNICFFAGAVKGNVIRAKTENERIVLNSVPRDENGSLVSEFAISFSESKRCAQMGLLRSTENSFDNDCFELEKRNGLKRIKDIGKKRPERVKGVLGYSLVREQARLTFPVDSKEKNGYLLCSARFCTLLSGNSLGVSFTNDINRGRITCFPGINDAVCDGERIVNEKDGFDFCKNAAECEILPYAVKYRGRYDANEYEITVSVHPRFHCKIICVEGKCQQGINFEIMPHERLNCHRYIGSGLVFFADDEKAHEKGYAFGYRIIDTAVQGAEYKLDDGIKVLFRDKGRDEFTKEKSVFCVGFASEETAFEIQKKIRETDFCNILSEYRDFCKKNTFLPQRMPDDVRNIMGKYFVFPKNDVLHRAFVKTSIELCLFDSLLMLYSDSREKHIKAEEISLMNPYDIFPRLVMCLFVSEYFRLTSDASFLEKRCGGDTLYRRCLSYLLDTEEKTDFADLYTLCLERFSHVCDCVGDVRTSQLLNEKKRNINTSENGGIFL